MFPRKNPELIVEIKADPKRPSDTFFNSTQVAVSPYATVGETIQRATQNINTVQHHAFRPSLSSSVITARDTWGKTLNPEKPITSAYPRQVFGYPGAQATDIDSYGKTITFQHTHHKPK